MNRQRFDVRAGLGSLKKKMPQHGGKKRGESGKPKQAKAHPGSGRQGYGIPILRQTVLAVVVCCLVLVGAGVALFTVSQSEIATLKSNLKAYTADGVVSAGTANEAINLSIEAVGARVAALESALTAATDGTMSSSELQWFGSELASVKKEAEALSTLLDEAKADSDVENSFAEEIHDPLVIIENGYAELSVSEDDVASTDLGKDGAATDTGAFKSSTGISSALKWIVILLVAVIILAVLSFLFRHQLGAFFGRSFAKISPKRGAKLNQEQKTPVSHKGKTGRRTVATPIEVTPAPEPSQAATEKPSFAFEESQPRAAEENRKADSLSQDPLDKLAPSFRKMAELEKALADAETPAQPGLKKITTAVSEEDFMSFDETVTNQSEIDESEDDLFSKGDKS